MSKRCCVVGAGVSGLAAVKQCLDEGIEPVSYEKDVDIGGLWHYREESKEGDPSLYNSCSINTSKGLTCYSDFLIPKDFPNFMHHTHFKRYLDMYADHFGLRKHIILRTEVVKIEKSDDFDETGRWIVTYKNLMNNKLQREVFDFVMVCNGHLHEPIKPDFPSLKDFKGQVIHTRDFKDFKGYENKRILVVGIGNSAADVACELSRHAKHVMISTRRGTYCIQRAGEFGSPYDQVAITRFRQALPHSLMRPVHFHKINYRYCHANYGLSPNFRFEGGQVTISDDLPNRILIGAISIHENVERFTETGVIFEDGSKAEDIDVVILGTGYKYSFPFLDDSIVKVEGHFSYLYKLVFPVDLKPCSLAVIGLVQPFGPLPPVLEMQARWAARVFAETCTLPPPRKRQEVVKKWRDYLRKTYVDSPRYSLQIYFIKYMDELAGFIGCRPRLWKLLFENPKLWYHVVFGPSSPQQWRLEGPGKWEGAEESILRLEEYLWYPMQTRKSGSGERVGLYDGWIHLFRNIAILVLFVIFFCFIISNGYHTYFMPL
ncbi:hypothetical protein CHS0354_024263 [Potamilus streckersoni]|uniref:Flavin-containing monooxygenase n=1 Tax=Potamilus streckersoni TaxID=2493646 RepID=A0AAE0SM09_9BIVA|nr:hypothetical protein CHS0354_024263 [Potamilus streckersoni]